MTKLLCVDCMVSLYDATSVVDVRPDDGGDVERLNATGIAAIEKLSGIAPHSEVVWINARPVGWFADTMIGGTALCRVHAADHVPRR